MRTNLILWLCNRLSFLEFFNCFFSVSVIKLLKYFFFPSFNFSNDNVPACSYFFKPLPNVLVFFIHRKKLNMDFFEQLTKYLRGYLEGKKQMTLVSACSICSLAMRSFSSHCFSYNILKCCSNASILVGGSWNDLQHTLPLVGFLLFICKYLLTWWD